MGGKQVQQVGRGKRETRKLLLERRKGSSLLSHGPEQAQATGRKTECLRVSPFAIIRLYGWVKGNLVSSAWRRFLQAEQSLQTKENEPMTNVQSVVGFNPCCKRQPTQISGIPEDRRF